MNIKRFSEITGRTIEILPGQTHYGYGLSDYEDLWDIQDWLNNGSYHGTTIHFYGSYIYFLQGNFNISKVILYKYLPGSCCKIITAFSISAINLYNLQIIGSNLNVISQDKKLTCYYPEQFEIIMKENESVVFIDDDLVYFTAWVEEGVVNDKITGDYRYYDKIIVKDKKGNIIYEEVGTLNQMIDGSWWIS
ncbi:MAG: hypothetical protein UDG84_05670 [Thomasclavelia sp.]|nr:hypothetical protein [Thomasclavelia sp.]